MIFYGLTWNYPHGCDALAGARESARGDPDNKRGAAE